MTSTVRSDLLNALKPLLPKTWRLIPYETSIDVMDRRPVVMLKLRSVTRTPQAPQSGLTASFILTIVEPKIDPETREDALDDKVLDLVHALDKVDGLTWTAAEKVEFQDSHFAYDITLETLSPRKA